MPDPAIGAFVDRVVQLQRPHSDLLLDPPGLVDGAFLFQSCVMSKDVVSR
jgi:hypothetical protein